MAISSPRHLRRQQNLKDLVDAVGGGTAFAALIGTPKSHISAMLAGSRGVGDAMAAKIEKKLEKAAGWMDEDHTAPISEAALIAGLADLKRINPETHDKLMRQLGTIIEGARASDQIIRTKTASEYVTPERAREVFGRQIQETRDHREPDPKLVLEQVELAAKQLTEYADRLRERTTSADAPPLNESLLGGPSGFGDLEDAPPPPPTPGRKRGRV